jgi:hypothetical protein
MSAEVAARRERFEAAYPHVKIWHDAGGWHARWPVNGTYSGVTHPCELSGLLDQLEALAAEAGEGQ